MVRNLPAIQESQVWSLDQEDPLEKRMATHSSILTWRIPWTKRPGRSQLMGSQRVRHDWAANTFNSNRELVVAVQSLSRVWLFVTPWTAACQASLSFTISWSLLRLTSIELVMPSKDLVLCCPLLLLPSIFPSIRVFSNELALCVRWPKSWSFSFSISPSNEYSGLISFRIDWFYLLVVQRTLKSLLQHHSSKVSIFWHTAFFRVQLSHPYMTTGKTIALTIQIFVGKEDWSNEQLSSKK